MKNLLKLALFAFVCIDAQADISIISTMTDGFNGTGSVTGVFSTVSAQVGDVIAVAAATNSSADSVTTA